MIWNNLFSVPAYQHDLPANNPALDITSNNYVIPENADSLRVNIEIPDTAYTEIIGDIAYEISADQAAWVQIAMYSWVIQNPIGSIDKNGLLISATPTISFEYQLPAAHKGMWLRGHVSLFTSCIIGFSVDYGVI
ncbi:hypothetical protein [Methylomicrobium sp. Wu6]|uniref:hypothetical protein n=1 Tax=Methylomicrobium sp. Wu6 TaxID=3107928 RepID=UPI002DD646BB|nr:hypothetical protein [Methylomicrobium sp. Wu6]MEC4749998.1 hypothetical protein [Methylomicrobium sp. Wu6]